MNIFSAQNEEKLVELECAAEQHRIAKHRMNVSMWIHNNLAWHAKWLIH